MNKERCQCGAGYWFEGETFMVQPHDMGCVRLREAVEKEAGGLCATCSTALVSERNGDVVYCPNGHTRKLKDNAAFELIEESGAWWIREVIDQ